MWKINSNYLQNDEIIEYTDRPSRLSCFFSYIWVGLVALTLLLKLIMDIATAMRYIDYSFYLTVAFFALPSIYVILKRLSTRYAISNRGLLRRTGIITNTIKTVPFKHITSIEVKETIIGKVFRYAHLLIDTSGSGKAIEFRWNYIVAAHKVKKLIEKHVGGEN